MSERGPYTDQAYSQPEANVAAARRTNAVPHLSSSLAFPTANSTCRKREIPRCLASLKRKTPVCVDCLFSQAHKPPWRSKSKKKHSIQKISDNYPGAKVSTDQLMSAQQALIPQMSRFLTNLRVTGATIFVDHFQITSTCSWWAISLSKRPSLPKRRTRDF